MNRVGWVDPHIHYHYTSRRHSGFKQPLDGAIDDVLAL